MSHAGLVLLFTSLSSKPCTLTGYPGVAALDASGREVLQARRTLHGYLGGVTRPTVVTLGPGDVASARVEGVDGSVDGRPCPKVTGLLVTPPGSHVSHRLGQTPGFCADVEIHPVVAGNTGGKP